LQAATYKVFLSFHAGLKAAYIFFITYEKVQMTLSDRFTHKPWPRARVYNLFPTASHITFLYEVGLPMRSSYIYEICVIKE